MSHLADLADITSYDVRLEFTDSLEPSSLSGDGLPFVSLVDEIEANTSSSIEGKRLRERFGRIPYGAPLYIWEVNIGGQNEVLYIGQTMRQTVQKRFEGHSAIIKLLADHVNSSDAKVFFRLCSRLDIKYRVGHNMKVSAIEHFPLSQARAIVDDLEAYLIFCLKPKYNTQYKSKEKAYLIPFQVTRTTLDYLRHFLL